MQKKWWESKTIWFNVVMTIVDIAALSSVVTFISPEVAALIQGIGNIILRVWFNNVTIEKTLV